MVRHQSIVYGRPEFVQLFVTYSKIHLFKPPPPTIEHSKKLQTSRHRRSDFNAAANTLHSYKNNFIKQKSSGKHCKDWLRVKGLISKQGNISAFHLQTGKWAGKVESWNIFLLSWLCYLWCSQIAAGLSPSYQVPDFVCDKCFYRSENNIFWKAKKNMVLNMLQSWEMI